MLDESPSELLARFREGGVIWRIFWLHCWQPERFPIYDQHVHRAMRFLQTGKPDEIPLREADKIRAYLSDYMPFHAALRRTASSHGGQGVVGPWEVYRRE
jgi:hypothetical protein